MKSLFSRRVRRLGIIILTVCTSIAVWNCTSVPTTILTMRIESFHPKSDVLSKLTWLWGVNSSADDSLNDVQDVLLLHVNMSALNNRVRNRKECADVAANPRSYWRSQNGTGSLNTFQADIDRMGVAISCGMLYPEYFSQRVLPTYYPVETFYLSDPPVEDINRVSNENMTVVTAYNTSLNFKVGEFAAFKIEMKDSRGNPKLKGGDQIRAWFIDDSSNSRMAAMVTDFSNGTYMASAPLLWIGKLRLNLALAYPREYIRALLYSHQVIKSFCHVAAQFSSNLTSEATPCYHTQTVPGHSSRELCDFTDFNGSPWFCGRPDKPQLNCSHYSGSVMICKDANAPVTDAEWELFSRASSKPSAQKQVACNKVLPQNTWSQEIPTGYLSNGSWHSRFCHLTQPDYTKCFKNKQVLFLGDSNGRIHYFRVQEYSKCADIKKALTKNWHKQLLCAHQANNFSVAWNPHANPFLSGEDSVASTHDLVPTSKAIDEIPSHGNYLIILNHYYHLTASHLSATEFTFRSIKDALVRLFRRNQNVHVLLQGPHIAWYGWIQHHSAGDMLGTAIIDLQQEIFREIQDKVVFYSPWDLTIATENYAHHPAVNENMFHVIFGFMCGR